VEGGRAGLCLSSSRSEGLFYKLDCFFCESDKIIPN